MDSNKLIVFGSFTEGEVRSWQKKPSEKSDSPLSKKEFLFGSLPVASGALLSGVNDHSSKKQTSFESGDSAKKVDDSAVQPRDISVGSGQVPKENGNINNSNHFSSLTNGVKEIKDDVDKLASLNLSKNDVTVHPEQSSGPLVAKELHQNGVHNKPGLLPTASNVKKACNGSISIISELLPRGLINAGNLCFLNATLQALLSCSPFVQLLQELRTLDIPVAGYPTLSAFAKFIVEFDIPQGSSSKKMHPNVIDTGRPFSPAMFKDVVKNFTPDVPSFSGRMRQEDAQEFLFFVMDQMHDELLKLDGHFSSTSGGNSQLVSSSEDDEWEIVGPKNKSAVTRTQSFVPSKLSAIFGGQLRSVVKAKGNKASATVQPYLLLQLDIFPEAVHSIEDAFRNYCATETLEEYRTSSAGKAGIVSASKSVKIQKLSKILILHLMRFSYGIQGSSKLHKPVHFPLELVLGRELLVSPTNEGRKYELMATITHHGRDHSKGHYTADARYPNGQWLRFDDASVSAIPISKVLHDQAYVLFYKQV